MPHSTISGLGPVAALNRHEVVDYVLASLREGRGGWTVTANLDRLRQYVANEHIRRWYSGSDLILADGQPLAWAARLQGTPIRERVKLEAGPHPSLP